MNKKHYQDIRICDMDKPYVYSPEDNLSIANSLLCSLSKVNDELTKELYTKDDKINELCDEILDLKNQLSKAKANIPWYRKLWLKVPKLSLKWEKRV